MRKTTFAAYGLIVAAAWLSPVAAWAQNKPVEAGTAATGAPDNAAAVNNRQGQQLAQSAPEQVLTETIGVYTFVYSYPGLAGVLPELKRYLEDDIAKRREVVRELALAYENMADEGASAMQLDHQVEWKLVTRIPGWVSFSGVLSGYDGGSHPNYAYLALLWNTNSDSKVGVLDLFLSGTAFEKAVDSRFNHELNRQRRQKRDGELGEGAFAEPLQPASQTIILGSSDGKRFNRIGFLVSPYQAGPYVEGSYEVTLPVDAALLQAVKPQYRKFFSLGQ